MGRVNPRTVWFGSMVRSRVRRVRSRVRTVRGRVRAVNG